MSFDANNIVLEEGLKKGAENHNLMNHNNNSLKIQKDFETLNFDELLEDLDYNILFLNLIKLLHFMESKDTELCFPLVSKKYEEIFKAIVLDATVLHSHKLFEYKDVCIKIINLFNDTKEFFVSCTREHREENNEVLVFKKLYTQATPMKKPLESLTSSLSSSMESLNILQSQPQQTYQELEFDSNVITRQFMKLSLVVLLDFVKFTTKYYLTFRNLTRRQAEYIESVVRCVRSGSQYVNKFGNKQLYTALWEAVRIFRSQYKIELEQSERNLLDNTLTVKKVLTGGNGEKAKIIKPTKENSIEKIIVQQEMNITTQKKESRKSRLIRFIDVLSPIFVIDTLKEIIEFIEDDHSARLILTPTNNTEKKFYRVIFNMSTSYQNLRYANYFKPYLEKIVELRKHCRLKIANNKSNSVSEKTGFREVIIVKTTQFGNTPSSSTKTRNALKKKYISAPSPSLFDMGAKKAKLSESSQASKSTVAEDYEVMPPPSHPGLSKKQLNRLKQDIRKSEKNAAKSTGLLKSGISFKPAGGEIAEATTESNKDPTTVLGVKNEWPEALTASKYKTQEALRKLHAQSGYELRTRRGKRLEQNAELIKALSVPVQCDKAMKMMRVMGWSGGALGARGEGITEPIMPTLELMAGAGLGHGPKQKITKTHQSGNQTPETELSETIQETDIIVAKTKQLLITQNFNIDQYQINQINVKQTKNIGNNTNQKKDPSVFQTKDIANNTNQKKDPAVFQIEMLKGVLELLSTNSTTKTIKFNERIYKKERRFVKSAFKTLAGGSRPEIKNNEEAKSIVKQVLELYRRMPPDVIVSVYLPDTNKEIVLTKIKSLKNYEKELMMLQKRNQETYFWIENLSKADIMKFLDGLAPPYHTKQVFKTMKFRVLITLKILFLVSDEGMKNFEEEIIFVFSKALPLKQQSFVEAALEAFNKKAKYGCTQFETAMGLEITKRMGYFILDLKFHDNYRIMTITKRNRYKTPMDIAVPIKSSRFLINLDDFIDQEAPKSKKSKANKLTNRFVSNNGNNINIVPIPNIPVKSDLNKAKDDDDSSDFDDDISCASDDDSQFTFNSENTNENKTLNSITSDKNIDTNSSTNNTLNCDKEAITNKVNIETNLSQTSVEDNRDVSTITEKIDSTKESISDNNVEKVDSTSGIVNIDSLEDCNIDLDTDLVDYDSSEEVELLKSNESSTIDLTSDEIIEENTIDSNIGKEIEIESDCDKIFNVDVSDKICDKKENSYGEVVSNVSQTDANVCSEISNVYIAPVNYPQDNITDEMAKDVQKLISHTILKSKELPLLMCHGVQNGALIYSCHNKKTLLWLQSTLSIASDLKVIDGKNASKIALKFHCLFDFDFQYLCRMIERYNPEISTSKWVMEKSEFHKNFALFLVQMDENSVNYIHASGLALFAGVDKVEFSLIF